VLTPCSDPHTHTPTHPQEYLASLGWRNIQTIGGRVYWHNALTGQMARHTYQIPIVICRIDDADLQNMYTDLGLQAISTTDLAAQTFVESAST